VYKQKSKIKDLGKITSLALENWLMSFSGKLLQDKIMVKMMMMMMMMMMMVMMTIMFC